MSLKHARWALEVHVEHLECYLEDESMSRHERAMMEKQLKDAREGLKELDAVADEARDLHGSGWFTALGLKGGALHTIARECQTPVPESGEEEKP